MTDMERVKVGLNDPGLRQPQNQHLLGAFQNLRAWSLFNCEVGKIIVPQRCPCPSPQNLVNMMSYKARGTSQGPLSVLGYPGGSNVITGSLRRKAEGLGDGGVRMLCCCL